MLPVTSGVWLFKITLPSPVVGWEDCVVKFHILPVVVP